MAHELDFQVNGRASMAYKGETPWHGLGQKIEANTDIAEWQKAAGLVWHVDKKPVIYQSISDDENTHYNTMDGKFVLVRSDNGTAFDVVSDRYKVVQPKQIMEFFRDLIEEIGGFEMETAGALFKGKKIWGLAKSTNSDALNIGNDKINRYILLSTSYDRTSPTIIQQTSVRVVCNNTLRTSMMSGNSEGRISFSHLREFNLHNIKQQMSLDSNWLWFCQAVEKMQQTKVSLSRAREFFTEILYPESKDTEEWKENFNSKRVNDMIQLYQYSPGASMSYGTNWGLMNAVTYHTDHKARSKSADVRLDKAWFGTGDAMKSKAFELLTV